MNWQKAAVEDLQKYDAMCRSLDNIPLRIAALKSAYESLSLRRGAATGQSRLPGGLSRIEDRLLDNIVERQRLGHSYKAMKGLVTLVRRGISGLDERERLVLERFFIRREAGHVEKLMEELHYEKSRVYTLKNQALYKFTLSMYGLSDL
jgi:hypothetical protein